MKMMRSWVAMALAVGSGPVLLNPAPADAQVRGRVADACPAGLEEGNLGISGLDCVGECTLTIRKEGSEDIWSFSTEPKIIGIERGGPAEGTLEVGDILVAIDGVLITTREGGRRYANLQPGEIVTVRYRRDGRVREGTIRVGTRCRDLPEPVGVAARVAPLPSVPDEPPPAGIAVVAPRVRVAPDRARTSVSVAERATGLATTSVARRSSLGLLAGSSPTGRLGIGFRCTECGTRTDEETDETVWFFSGPLEVTAVNVGGPAEEAGIKRGDLIKAIDGKSIDTEEGGLAFTRITPGESVRLTLVRRNGSEEDVSLVPEEAETLGLAGGRGRVDSREPRRASAGVTVVTPEVERRPSRVTTRPPGIPDPAEDPSPLAEIEPPEGMPLRYSGVVNGVEIEVRGNPVTVSDMRGSRTIYINADGLWIRISVPRRTVLLDGEALEAGSLIRR